MEIIIGRQGGQSMPITDPTVSRKHCKVIAHPDGTFTVENLSDYGTMVDGHNIVQTSATHDSMLQLGPNFKATLRQLIGGIPLPSGHHGSGNHKGTRGGQTSPANQEVPTFNISHLRRIWEDFNQTNLDNARIQKKINMVRTAGMILSVGGGLIASLSALPVIGIACSAVGVISLVYSFIGMQKSESAEDRQRRVDAFEDQWVCPNPACGKSIRARNYKLLVRDYTYCQHCKCKFVER